MKTKAHSPLERQEKAEPVATVERGNVALAIYPSTNIVSGKAYPQFRFTYTIGDQRIRKRFADLDAAKREAELVATKLHNGEAQVLKLTNSDRENYIEALALLKPFGLRLNSAIQILVQALKLLPEGTSLVDAVKSFVNRSQSVKEIRTVAEVVTEFLARQEKDKASSAHLRPLTLRLTRFGQAFQMPVSQVTASLVQHWIDEMDAAPRTKRNELRNVTSMIKFAVDKKYAASDLLLEIKTVKLPKLKAGKTPIFRPDELEELFAAAPDSLVPWLAIGAFCGLRTAEILRLDWRDVKLDRKFITVEADKSKTAARRIVPLCDAAIRWLQPHVQKQGPVAPFIRDNWLSEALPIAVNKVRKEAGNLSKFVWQRNGLRHSFASYRLAIVQSVDQVALECGNSPRMVFAHYRELTTAEDAQKWFSVNPPSMAENVIPIPKAVAS